MITTRGLTHAIKECFARRPLFDGQVRAYLTLRCNAACPYCVNMHVDDGSHIAEYTELAPQEWSRLLCALDRDCVITGGEPFLYRGLSEVVLSVAEKRRVTIYTNLFGVLEPHREMLTHKNVSLYISYHHDVGSAEQFCKNLQLLKDWGVRFSVHLVSVHDESIEKRLVKTLKHEYGVAVVVDRDQRDMFHESSAKQSKKRVVCNRRIILIAPDGKRYQCVSHMVRRVHALQDLISEPLGDEAQSCICDDYGFCAPCDGLGETIRREL